jgi:5-methylcytosine-specific restriction enzyme A
MLGAPREPRRSAYARGYTKRWDRESKSFRLRYPLCGMRPLGQVPVMSQCFLEQRETPATLTDHVRPHRGDRLLMWDAINNWQSMCDSCHARKTQAGL